MTNDQNSTVEITVFTPAYNRAHTIGRTYESLKRQTNKNFLWMIIDDGSTDNTGKLVEEWQKKETEFEIQYIYQENGGMHTAHNTAYRNIKTELNVCIDSDDCLTDHAIALILDRWHTVKDKNYAGIIGLDINLETGEVIGTGFEDGLEETTLSGYYNRGGKGDKKLVYRTDLIKQTPEYPVFEGEKYYSLSYKYLLIDEHYSLNVLNEPLCKVEYQPDGSSHSMYRQYLANPKGFANWRIFRMKRDETLKRKVIDCIHYCSSSQLAHNSKYIQESPDKLLTIICTPLGRILTRIVKKRAVS